MAKRFRITMEVEIEELHEEHEEHEELELTMDETISLSKKISDTVGDMVVSEISDDTKRARIDYQKVRSLYNITCAPKLPRCIKVTLALQKAIRARMNEGYTIEDFQKAFEKAAMSDFLCGKNKQNWRVPGLLWILSSEHMVSLLEGKYDNRTAGFESNTSYDIEAFEKQGFSLPEGG